jgi:hypothetical protein
MTRDASCGCKRAQAWFEVAGWVGSRELERKIRYQIYGTNR